MRAMLRSGGFWRAMRLCLLVLALSVAFVALWFSGHTATSGTALPTPAFRVVDQRPTCALFASQAAAQAAYRGDPSGFVALDGDHDGTACERAPAPYDTTPVRWEVRP